MLIASVDTILLLNFNLPLLNISFLLRMLYVKRLVCIG